jgi:hypothetical protein
MMKRIDNTAPVKKYLFIIAGAAPFENMKDSISYISSKRDKKISPCDQASGDEVGKTMAC